MTDMDASLDEIDRHILAELRQDGRLSMSALAERVHISRAHAYTRFNRLVESGAIRHIGAIVDPVKTGLKSSAYVMLKVKQHSWRSLREALTAIEEVHHIALVGSGFDVIILVRAEDNEHLRSVVFDQLQNIPGVLDTQTALIFDDLDTR